MERNGSWMSARRWLRMRRCRNPDKSGPGERSLHHPPMEAEATAMFSEALRQDWLNPQGAQHLPMGFRAIGSVSLNSVWPMAWPASLATHRRNGCHQCIA
jgi:hypothetical protein